MGSPGRPRGVTVIGCRCANPAWPLLQVQRPRIEDPRQCYRDWDLKWNLLERASAVRGDGIRGKCPHCKRSFHAETTCADFFHKSVGEILAREDIPEDALIEASSPSQAKSYGYTKCAGPDGTITYGWVIVVTSPNAYVLPRSQRKEQTGPRHRQLLSPSGLKTLLIDSEEKALFERAMDALRELQISASELPDWQASGSPEQFTQWGLELYMLCKRPY